MQDNSNKVADERDVSCLRAARDTKKEHHALVTLGMGALLQRPMKTPDASRPWLGHEARNPHWEA